MIQVDEVVLATLIQNLQRIALKAANGPTEFVQSIGHEVGREASTIKDGLGWTDADVNHWLDHRTARFLEPK